MKSALFVHGAFAGGWVFESIADLFQARGFQCFTPDLRGHGERDREVREEVLQHRSVADYSAEMCELASTLPRPLIVAGHSMGGLIALEMASKGWADAVILLNSSVPYGILPSTEDERAVAKMLMSSGAFWERVLRLDFSIQAEYGLNMLALDEQRRVFDRLDAESGRAIFEIFFWMFDEERTTEMDFQSIRCPVLVVSGSEDRAVSQATARSITDRIGKNATFLSAEGHGHYITLEPRLPDIAEKCFDWLSQI